MSAVTYLTPTKAPGWAQGQWPKTKERATRSSGVPAAMPSTEQVSDPNPSCPGQPIMSSPQAQRPLNPRPPLAWFKIPLVSHKTGDPAYCRKAEQRNFQPGSPQTQGYTSQPPSTKPPERSLLRLGRCGTGVSGKLQRFPYTRLLGSALRMVSVLTKKKHPDRGSLEPTARAHMFMHVHGHPAKTQPGHWDPHCPFFFNVILILVKFLFKNEILFFNIHWLLVSFPHTRHYLLYSGSVHQLW